MAEWINIWNQEQRNDVRNRGPGHTGVRVGEELGSAYVPWGMGLIGEGDYIYAVGVEDGELLVINRLCVGWVGTSPKGNQEVEVEALAGTETSVLLDRLLAPEQADELEFLNAGGSTLQIKRRDDGKIEPNQFRGRGSLRELIGPSAEILDSVIGPR